MTQEAAVELHHLVCAERARLRQTLPWLDGIRTVSDTHAYLRRRLQLRASAEARTYFLASPETILGVVGLDGIATREPSVGYWIAGDAEGRGLVTAAVDWICATGFREDGLARIYLRCGTENGRSQRVAERCGFVLLETRRGAENLYGRSVDHLVYVRARRDDAACRPR